MENEIKQFFRVRDLPLGHVIRLGTSEHGLSEKSLKRASVELFHDINQGLEVSDLDIVRTIFQRAGEMDNACLEDISLTTEVADFKRQSFKGRFRSWWRGT